MCIALALTTAPLDVRAQEHRADIEAEARAALDAEAQLELSAIEAQQRLVGDLYVATAVLIAVGLATALAGSIGSMMCEAECTAWHATAGGGAAVAGVGLALFVPATFLANDAEARRRRVLLEHLAISPLPSGAMATLRLPF